MTAAAVGYFAFDATLDGSQWLGVAVTTGVVLVLPITGPRVVRVPREVARDELGLRGDHGAERVPLVLDQRCSCPGRAGSGVALVLTRTPGRRNGLSGC